mgnify:CR=1 FL=1
MAEYNTLVSLKQGFLLDSAEETIDGAIDMMLRKEKAGFRSGLITFSHYGIFLSSVPSGIVKSMSSL